MKLNLQRLLAGECPSLSFQFTLTPLPSTDPTSPLYGVHFSPAEVAGTVVNNAGYMRMELTMTVSYTAPCARCLTDVPGTFSYSLEKTVVPAGMLANIKEEEADDYAILHNGILDMDEELLELLDLSFPAKVLCKEDCAGICPTCGKNLNDGACTCKKKEIDPRLASLAALYEKLRAEETNEENK